MILFIMYGQSFLRQAIACFLRTELETTDVLPLKEIEEIYSISNDQARSISLVLLHVGSTPVQDENIQGRIEALCARFGGIPIALIGDLADDRQVKIALSNGTSGYISVETPSEIVKHALPIIARGGVYAPPFVYSSSAQQDALAENTDDGRRFEDTSNDAAMTAAKICGGVRFTNREFEVLTLLGEGLPNKIIAHRLGLKEGTVKVHVRHIMKKLNVTSRTQAALLVQQQYLTPAERPAGVS